MSKKHSSVQLYNSIIERIYFGIIVTLNFFKLLFKKNNNLEEVFVSKVPTIVYTEQIITIQFNYKNVLWYEFVGITNRFNPGIIYINANQLEANCIKLIVHGFFEKKSIKIPIQRSGSFFNVSMKDHFIKGVTPGIINNNQILLNPLKSSISHPPIHINNRIISFTNSVTFAKKLLFNQNDFI